MTSTRPPTKTRIARALFLLFMFSACGQTEGCDGCGAEGPEFPDKDRVHSAVQVRISDEGVNALEEVLEPLFAEALPEEGLSFCIPGDGGSDPLGLVEFGFCMDEVCEDGTQGCQSIINIDSVDLATQAPDQLTATVRFSELEINLDLEADPIVDCSIQINGPGFEVGLPLTLSTPGPTRVLTFDLAQGVEYDLRDIEVRLRSQGGGLSFLCTAIDGVINLPFLGDLIFQGIQAVIDGVLATQIRGFVESFTCTPCMADMDCPQNFGATCVEGLCRLPDNSCVPQALGAEGIIDVGEILGGVSPGLSAPIQYLGLPGSYVDVENGGLSLGVIAGAISDRNRCVPERPQPEVLEPPRTDLLRGNVDPGGQSFDVGIGVTDDIIGHVMWAIYNGGALCLSITSETIAQLSAGTLSIGLPNLLSLARGNDAPVAITMAPQQVPRVQIGSNTFVENENGMRTLEDPLLTMTIPELWLDFHIFMEDRWTRIFSLHADVVLPLGLDFTPDNALIPIIGDLSQALTNVRAVNGEIMEDDPSELAGLLPVLVGALGGTITSGIDPIALPDILGVRLNLQDGGITGIEDNTMLAVFAQLEPVPPEMEMPEGEVPEGEMPDDEIPEGEMPEGEMPEGEMPEGQGARAQVETVIDAVSVEIPSTDGFLIDSVDAWKRPVVRLDVDAWDGTPDPAAMEFSYRVGQSGWSPFHRTRSLEIRHPYFLLQGRHQISVRARRVDNYRTLDPTPAMATAIIDSVAPDLALFVDGQNVRIEMADAVSPLDALRVEIRRDGETWQQSESLTIAAEGAERLRVRVSDEAGNVTSDAVQMVPAGLIGRPPADQRGGEEDGGCGCRATSAESPSPWSLLALGLLLGFRRRRQTAVCLLLGGLIFVVAGCEDDANSRVDPDMDMGAACSTNDDCEESAVCVEGVCAVIDCSDDPSQCDALDCGTAGTQCNEGVCACLPFCPDGCGEGEFCCQLRNACETASIDCSGTVCEPGFEGGVVVEGEIDPIACERVDAECGCVEKAPLETLDLGRFSALAVHDDAAWVSGYDSQHGDLIVGRALADGFEWQWVDGVPDEGEIVAGPSGPRGGLAEAGPDVGRYTSLAIDDEGRLHVAYYDVTNRALKYARSGADQTGPWVISTLDAEGDAGRWASIAVNPDGVPGVAYRVGSVPEGDGHVSQLRFIEANGAAPTTADDWGTPLVLHTRALATPDPDTATYPEGTGLFASQARDPQGLPVVAWYDRSEGQLWWSRMVEAGFTAPEMLAGWGHPDPDRDGDMGANVNLWIDGEGNAHLCYQDGMTDSLRYLAPELDRDEWVDDGVWLDVGGRGYSVHVVGDDCTVRLDGDGAPLIVYQDATLHALLLRRRTLMLAGADDLTWAGRRALRGDMPNQPGEAGFYASAVVVGEQVWATHYVFDNTGDGPTYRLEFVVQDL